MHCVEEGKCRNNGAHRSRYRCDQAQEQEHTRCEFCRGNGNGKDAGIRVPAVTVFQPRDTRVSAKLEEHTHRIKDEI